MCEPEANPVSVSEPLPAAIVAVGRPATAATLSTVQLTFPVGRAVDPAPVTVKFKRKLCPCGAVFPGENATVNCEVIAATRSVTGLAVVGK